MRKLSFGERGNRIRGGNILAPSGAVALDSGNLFSSQDVGNDRGATATDALGHAGASAVDLILAGFMAQLLHNLDDLVDTGRTNRMAASLQPAERGRWDAPSGEDVTVQAQPRALSTFGKTAGLQR